MLEKNSKNTIVIYDTKFVWLKMMMTLFTFDKRILFNFIIKESRYTFAIIKTVLIVVIFGLL